jgi:hypothetical protein
MKDFNPHRRADDHRHWVTGLILIGVGSAFLMERLGYIESFTLRQYWPGIIALVGAGQMLAARHSAQFIKGAFLIFLAGWLYASIQHLWGLSFHNSWPLILIAVGLTHIAGGLSTSNEKRIEESQP